MKHRSTGSIGVISFVILLLGAAALFSQTQPLRPETGEISLKVMIVTSDLTIKPVPKKTFRLRRTNGPPVEIRVTTGFSGEATAVVPPGDYLLESEAPLEFENSRFSWQLKLRVHAGRTVNLELSNDNATVVEISAAPADVELNEGELYRQYKDSVFKVLAESFHGSGFLVDSSGLILTNHHVIANSEYLAVKTSDKEKYPCQLIVADEFNDIAVLRVHPQAISQQRVIALAEDDPANPRYSVGQRVVAIGSPLATETILTSGLISKVEEGAIYSDVNINPGNSGGPLFNMRGEVIGINTFSVVSQRGPGVSGIVRIHLAQDLLETARQQAATIEPPPPTLLPVESTFRYPAEELRSLALTKNLRPQRYHVEAGKMDVQFITPVVTASLEVAAEAAAMAQREKRSKKKKKKSKAEVQELAVADGFYEWRRYGGDYSPVVHVQAIPEITMTGGSTFAVVMLGPNVPKKYKFKTDFDRMELYRDGTLVQPIHPGRVAQVVSKAAGLDSLHDIGIYGAYDYPPEAFKPGATLTLKVWQQGKPEPKVKELQPELLAELWEDFKPYFDSLEEAVQVARN